jgi:hypothetical protein
MWALLLIAALAADPACDSSLPDADADGLDGGADCDDCDPTVWVGADERCDGVDNDCDGVVDRLPYPAGAPRWWDRDGDGFGAEEALESVCGEEEDVTPRAGDCDDTNPRAYPGGVELCDDADNDCDGSVDGVNAVDVERYYVDRDGDGLGWQDRFGFFCEDPGPQWTRKTVSYFDCNDRDPLNECFDTCAQAHPGDLAPLALLFFRRRRPAA